MKIHDRLSTSRPRCFGFLLILSLCIGCTLPDGNGNSSQREHDVVDGGDAGVDGQVQFDTVCVPVCGQRDCGPDPVCEESCGECGEGVCSETGFCEVEGGPQISELNANTNQLTEGESLRVTASVTDPDGAEDVVGGTLFDDTGAPIGEFLLVSHGSFIITVTWEEIHAAHPIEFESEAQLNLIAVFTDAAAHRTAATLTMRLHCDGLGACQGICVNQMSDPLNCGRCGWVCADDGTCDSGSCSGGVIEPSWDTGYDAAPDMGYDIVPDGGTQTQPDVGFDTHGGAETGYTDLSDPPDMMDAGIETDLSVAGVFHTTVADIDFTGAIVDATLGHKVDVDPSEDGCIASLSIDLRFLEAGCRLSFEFSELDDGYGGLTSISLQADSFCPGFPDAEEGLYSSEWGYGGYWFDGPTTVTNRMAGSAWLWDVDVSFPEHEIVLERYDGREITVDLSDIQLQGDLHSEGETGYTCIESSTCAPGYHDGGNRWCLREGFCVDGFHDDGTGDCVALGVCADGYRLESGHCRHDISSVDVGWFHTCGVRTDGSVVCWGDDAFDQLIPPIGPFERVVAGDVNTCAVASDGSVSCWGQDTGGESSPPDGAYRQVDLGAFHGCGVRSDSTVVCWGSDYWEQSSPPTGAFRQVGAGFSFSCGLRTDGSISCWGDDTYGQSTPPIGTFNEISVSNAHGCGVQPDGTVSCWGNDEHGQSTPPTGSFGSVTAGDFHTCGLRLDGTVACWGDDGHSQASPPTGTFASISAGGYHTCGIRTDGNLVCWGDDSEGQSTPP